ncbi:MAG: glycosyltransferase [Proteobacteria bacterium]|nr:glycosyltransferase [Pseudomonadota bacterium]
MAYSISLIHEARFPVQKYGGTERVVWWLAKGLSELGHQVNLICLPGSSCSFGRVYDLREPRPQADITHFFNTPSQEPDQPYLVTIEGNAKAGEVFLPNTVFVSHNHAQRNGSEVFVYNGLDPDEYFFSSEKSRELLFLAKASWAVKNVKGAIQIARRAGKKLNVVGGSRWWCPVWRGIHWRGMLGGTEKARWISRSEGLLFPVLWNEPFGIAVTEALVSGTPVLATPFGSLKELIDPQVGRICHNYGEFISAAKNLGEFKPKDCRDWALSRFHYREMAKSYLKKYETVLSGKKLNSVSPQAPKTIEKVPFEFS